MRKFLFATTAAALLLGGAAMAAEVALTIEPAHRTVIKQYVVKRNVAPIRMRQTFQVGTAIPAAVTIQAVPADLYADVPEIQNYDYFYMDGKVVLVDRNTREVVDIIE